MSIKTWIVEDNVSFRREIAQEIARSEDIVCTHQFGAEAEFNSFLEDIDATTLPDVVLMDIKLEHEEEAGIRCTRRLKDLKPDVAVVMLTSFDDSEKIYKAIQAGANSYLLKDQAFDQLLTTIRRATDYGMLMPRAVAQKVRAYFDHVSGENDYNLTDREREVLQEMCNGLTQPEMARTLFISENTVGQHVRNIYLKLQVNTRGGAVAKAFREKLVD